MTSKLYGRAVWQYLAEKFNTSVLMKTDRYEVGTVLHTAHARQWSNATIVGMREDDYIVLTDIGNFMVCSAQELTTMYLPPVSRRVATTEQIDWNNLYIP